jgi:hypothetical protein
MSRRTDRQKEYADQCLYDIEGHVRPTLVPVTTSLTSCYVFSSVVTFLGLGKIQNKQTNERKARANKQTYDVSKKEYNDLVVDFDNDNNNRFIFIVSSRVNNNHDDAASLLACVLDSSARRRCLCCTIYSFLLLLLLLLLF